MLCLLVINIPVDRSAFITTIQNHSKLISLQVHFNVYSSPRIGQDWGTFTTDTELPPELGGPSYHEEVPGNRLSANKVSMVNGNLPWDSVLLARLRFKPDNPDPTST